MSEIRPYVVHAEKFGIHNVYETALEEGELGSVELADLVKALRKLQKQRGKRGFHNGVPDIYSHQRKQWVPASDTWQAPQGILDSDNRKLLTACLLSDGQQVSFIRDRLGVTKAYVQSVREALDASVPSNSTEESSMSVFRLTFPDGEIREVEAADLDAARKEARESMGVSRLPNGTVVEEVEEQDLLGTDTSDQEGRDEEQEDQQPSNGTPSKSDWRDLPKSELLEYLLAKVTIPDRAHTDQQRQSGEKRADFLRRIYG